MAAQQTVAPPENGPSVDASGLSRLRRTSPLLRVLPPADIDALLALATSRRVPAGQLIALEGQHDDRCYLVLDGIIKQQRAILDGRELIQGLRGSGEMLNLHVAFGRQPAPSTLTSLVATSLLQIAGADLRCLLASRPTLLSSFAGVLDGQLLRAGEENVWLSSTTATTRILRCLLELTELCGRDTDHGRVVTCTLSQDELGSWASSSRETVAKVLQRLRTDGLIDTGRRYLLVRDLPALRRRVADGDTVGLALTRIVA